VEAVVLSGPPGSRRMSWIGAGVPRNFCLRASHTCWRNAMPSPRTPEEPLVIFARAGDRPSQGSAAGTFPRGNEGRVSQETERRAPDRHALLRDCQGCPEFERNFQDVFGEGRSEEPVLVSVVGWTSPLTDLTTELMQALRTSSNSSRSSDSTSFT